MAEGRLSEEVLTMVHAFPDNGRKDAVRQLASRIAKLEAVVEAQAKVIELLEQTSGGGCGCALCMQGLDAAKAELERVKLPTQPQPSERVEDVGEGET